MNSPVRQKIFTFSTSFILVLLGMTAIYAAYSGRAPQALLSTEKLISIGVDSDFHLRSRTALRRVADAAPRPAPARGKEEGVPQSGDETQPVVGRADGKAATVPPVDPPAESAKRGSSNERDLQQLLDAVEPLVPGPLPPLDKVAANEPEGADVDFEAAPPIELPWAIVQAEVSATLLRARKTLENATAPDRDVGAGGAR
jgi:hypothetical protein